MIYFILSWIAQTCYRCAKLVIAAQKLLIFAWLRLWWERSVYLVLRWNGYRCFIKGKSEVVSAVLRQACDQASLLALQDTVFSSRGKIGDGSAEVRPESGTRARPYAELRPAHVAQGLIPFRERRNTCPEALRMRTCSQALIWRPV